MKIRIIDCILALSLLMSAIFCSGAKPAELEYLITSNSIGKVSLGMSFRDIERAFSGEYLVRGNAYQLQIFRGDEQVLVVSTIEEKKRVTDISTTSRRFKTREKIGVGTTLDELAKMYPKMEIVQDPESGEEYFLPNNYVTKDSRVSLHLASKNGESIGLNYRQKGDSYIATHFRRDGGVDSITVFQCSK